MSRPYGYGEGQYGEYPQDERNRYNEGYQQERPSYGNESNYENQYGGRPEQNYYGGDGPPNEQQQQFSRQGEYGYGQEPPYGERFNESGPPRPGFGQQSHGGGQEYPPYEQRGYAQGYEGQGQGYAGPGPYGAEGAQGGDGDRGLMGALAGGAAGAYGGHKVGHGFLGTVGGAVAGSLLEDEVKKHHRKEEEEKRMAEEQQRLRMMEERRMMEQQRFNAGPPQFQGGGGGAGVFVGSFHSSSRDVHLDGHHLVAHCEDREGRHHKSKLDLNRCLGNDGGRFVWAEDGDFAHSAKHFRLEHGHELEGELRGFDGRWMWARIDLNERISNEDGNLVMMW